MFFFSACQPPEVELILEMKHTISILVYLLLSDEYVQKYRKKFFLNGPLVLGGAVCWSVTWPYIDGFGPPDPAPVSGVSTIFSN